MLLFIVDYYSKFHVVKKVGSLEAENLAHISQIIFAEYGLPKKIISATGSNLTLETSRQFCRLISIKQSIVSSYYHQSNGQVEACIKFYEMRNKKCFGTNQYVIVAILQMESTPMCTGLPSPARLLFKRPIKGLLPQMFREPIHINNDDAQYEALRAHQNKYVKNNDTHKDPSVFL